MKEELHYRIALTMIPELGPVIAKQLIEHFGDAVSVFKARKKELSNIEGVGELRARYLKEWNAHKEVEAEIAFAEKHHIQCLFITDKDYPKRLLHCYDPPTILYYRGTVDLNSSKIISIIGTRNHTEYGKQVTEQLIAGLQAQNVMIISGLALGIDAIAHKTSLQYQIPTIGVLAHGLDIMYPSQHTGLAKEMLLHGGLITEFRRSNKPDKHHFPKRNRIVAGMSDATIVIETAMKGGSMITAELAHSYNRDLFAIPGKITDYKSSGCLKLIQQNKAALLTGADHLIETMGWQEKKRMAKKQRELFIDLSDDEKMIVELLREQEMIPIDELFLKSRLSSSRVAGALLNLELQNVVCSLPGKIYKLL
jgi:DNA processing protein